MVVSGYILFVDAFDSFTNNVVGLVESSLHVHVSVVHMNDAFVWANLKAVLKTVDAVVVGPGPGHPSIQEDMGFIDQLWSLSPRSKSSPRLRYLPWLSIARPGPRGTSDAPAETPPWHHQQNFAQRYGHLRRYWQRLRDHQLTFAQSRPARGGDERKACSGAAGLGP